MEHLVALAVAVAALAAPAAATAAPVGDALDRPAVQAAHPERAVLLAAAQAGQRIVAVGERGIVLLSDDGAAKWRQVPVPTSVTLTAVRFVDDKHGWAVGHGGVILASTDGGATWTRQLDGKTAADLMLKAAQASGDPAAVKEAEWLVSAGADKPFLDLHFFDAKHGIVVGAYNLAFETRDGGQTWSAIAQRLDNPRGLHLYAVRARGDKVLIVGEQGAGAAVDRRRADLPEAGHRLSRQLLQCRMAGRQQHAAGRPARPALAQQRPGRELDPGAVARTGVVHGQRARR